MKYLDKYGERNYSRIEISNICKEYKIKKNQFIKYIMGNRRSYKLSKKSFEEGKSDIYIGKNKRASNELIEKIHNEFDKKIEFIAKNIIYMHKNSKQSFEDLKQNLYLELIETGGKIETNFSYDKDLAINILVKRAKYSMLKYLGLNKSEVNSIVKTVYGELDLLELVEDNRYNPEILLEEKSQLDIKRVEEIHSKIVKMIKIYSDLIFKDREYGLEAVELYLNLNKKEMNKKIIEIQSFVLNSGLAKYDSKGRIILNEIEEY